MKPIPESDVHAESAGVESYGGAGEGRSYREYGLDERARRRARPDRLQYVKGRRRDAHQDYGD